MIPALALAYALFAMTFRGRPAGFWRRMTLTGLVLGGLAVAGGERVRPRPRDVPLGLAVAAGLYGIFLVGDRMARRLVPGGEEQIRDIYALRRLDPPGEIAARLALAIAPAEELFWRGWLQRRLARRYGSISGALAAAAAYGGAHLATGNVTLIGAAAVAGLYWSALAAAGVPMAALIVSHMAWDIWIFLLAPTEKLDP